MLIDDDNNQEDEEEVEDDSATTEDKDSKEEKTDETEGKESKEGEDQDDDEFDFEDDGAKPEDKKEIPDTDKKDDDSDEEDEDKKLIQAEVKKGVDKELADFRAEREATRVATELQKLTTDYPELKKAEAKIKRYAEHSSYKGKSVSEVTVAALGIDVFLKIGAARSKKANEEAKETKGNGQGARKDSIEKGGAVNGIPSFIGKTSAQIKDITNKVRSGYYNK